MNNNTIKNMVKLQTFSYTKGYRKVGNRIADDILICPNNLFALNYHIVYNSSRKMINFTTIIENVRNVEV